ncbi:MAG TPA: sterol desaturase family protein [Oligoflexia bacterium]|nr:sterol desaturase family protein [Oligoflexia bacterium]HMR25334.1 sterol desaturase family protein [Oligoflexia bacterium]
MSNIIFKPEYIRLFIFLLGLIVFSSLEFFFPYRLRSLKRRERWPANILMALSANFLIKLLLPTGLIFFSLYAAEHKIGFFNNTKINPIVQLFFSLLILDFGIYVQHIVFHKVPLFWRFHKVHHADIDLDASSALRFHPLEIIVSLLYKGIIVIALGISVQAVLIFEILLNFMAMFNHANIHIPKKIERLLRFFIVTPQMHIVHHSIDRKQSDTNYGFNLSIWDKLFKTYQAQFKNDTSIGLSYYRKASEHRFIKILFLPFKHLKQAYDD